MRDVYDAAYQGRPGAFSEMAAWEMLGESARLLPYDDLEDVFAWVGNGNPKYGVVPIENTNGGSIHRTYDLFHEKGLVHIVGETVRKIEHSLIAGEGMSLSDVREVYSHPQALAQCSQFFHTHRRFFKGVAAFDTAGAVEKVIRKELKFSAAIAHRRNAEIYGGVVLADNIQNTENFTRFLLITREGEAKIDPTRSTKATIVFHLKHTPGALSKALQPFASRGINLTKIESMPRRGNPFEYEFYVDVVAEPGKADNISKAITEVKRFTTWLGVLGIYPAWRGEK